MTTDLPSREASGCEANASHTRSTEPPASGTMYGRGARNRSFSREDSK